jgi:hypothetical protein
MVPVRFTVVEPAAPESIPIDNRFTANDRSGFKKGFHEKLIDPTMETTMRQGGMAESKQFEANSCCKF